MQLELLNFYFSSELDAKINLGIGKINWGPGDSVSSLGDER